MSNMSRGDPRSCERLWSCKVSGETWNIRLPGSQATSEKMYNDTSHNTYYTYTASSTFPVICQFDKLVPTCGSSAAEAGAVAGLVSSTIPSWT